jgi:hypothetical protein
MTATDEDAFLAWLAAEEAKHAEPAEEAEPEPGEEAEPEPGEEAEPEPGEEAEPEPGEEAEPEPGEEAEPEPGEEAEPEPGEEAEPEPGEGEAPRDVKPVTGLRRTYIFVEIRKPGIVEYEVHFGFGDVVKRSGTAELSEDAFERVYDLVRRADLFGMERRHIGDAPTGKKETFVAKGNLKLAVIDVQGKVLPNLDNLWREVKAILLDKDSRIFDNPKERADIFIMDRRTLEFHRGDCPRLKEISDEFRIRLKSVQECLNREGWPCETCRPLDR